MNYEAFEAKFLDELAGMMFDALINDRTGAQGVVWFRQRYGKLRATVRAMYDTLKPPVKPDPPKAAEEKPK